MAGKACHAFASTTRFGLTQALGRNRDHGESVGTIEINKDGKTYEAEYSIEQGLVTVYGDRDQETTQLGGLSEQQVAKFLLSSLIRKGYIDPIGPDAA